MPAIVEPHESKIYHNFSHWYDRLFSPFFMRRIHSTIRGLDMPEGSKVLEVGVGTGLSLDAYPEHVDVTGVDLSDDMLSHAQRKIDAHGWKQFQLRQMDALNLDFPDASFDYVMAFHLVTVVPDTNRLMQEMTRVCKPGGKLVIINHLRSERRWIAGMVDAINPLAHLLGWRTTLKYQDLVAAAPVKVIRRFKTSPQSLFTVIVAEKTKEHESRQAV